MKAGDWYIAIANSPPMKRELERPRCSVPGCNRRVNARGLCRGDGKDPTRTIRA